jgi:hypothetical protein
MEYDTLTETGEKLPKFAGQLGVPVADLRRVLNEDWLPHIDVVKLPGSLRAADRRALQVQDRDAGDYPAAALAALLSPCLLLTHNYNHFGALGMHTHKQGVDGVIRGEITLGRSIGRHGGPPHVGARVVGRVRVDLLRIRARHLGACAVLISDGIYWYHKAPGTVSGSGG